MTADDGNVAEQVDVEGMALEEAVEAVLAADASRDREQVREALEYVTDDDDIVARSALDEVGAVLAENVSGAREQASDAQLQLTNAREVADPITDLETVERRLDTYEGEMWALTEQADDLAERHDALTDRYEDPDSLYAVADEFRAVFDEAQRIEARIYGLKEELSEFETDVTSPEVWINDVQQDLTVVEDALDAVAAAADALPAADADVEDDWDWADRDVDPPVVWYDATLRVAHVGVLLADLRAEMDDLQTWGERKEEFETWYAESVSEDLQTAADRRSELADRLDALARPAWTDRFSGRLADFESELADQDSPVDWVEMQAVLDAYRPESLDA
jgi:hypothetical protein